MNTLLSIENYGWSSFFEGTAKEYIDTGLIPGRIIETRRAGWLTAAGLPGEETEIISAEISGRFAHGINQRSRMPCTGDWVMLLKTSGGPALIKHLLPRKTYFSRKAKGNIMFDKIEEQVLASNVDTAFVVAAAGYDFNPRRIERYITLAWESGAQPVLVITKIDLAEDPELLNTEAAATVPGVPVLALSAKTGQGMELLNDYLKPGKTGVLLGSSGAGKSTLINYLLGETRQAVNTVRSTDHHGRHTTTSRTLFVLPPGGLIIDTPGLREIQLWTNPDGVDTAFSDIDDLLHECRFNNCSHNGEPGCAIEAALESGELDEARYNSWIKLRKEAAYLERRNNKALEAAENEKWKAITKIIRHMDKGSKGMR